MPAAMITFIGEKETGVKELTWGPDIKLPAGKAVLVDSDDTKSSEHRTLAEHLLSVAPTHPHFKVEEVKGKAKAKAVEPAEDDYPEEKEDEPPLEEQNHKTLIARAHRAGAPESVNSKDEAIAWLRKHPDA